MSAATALLCAALICPHTPLEYAATFALDQAKREAMADHVEHGGMIIARGTDYGTLYEWREAREPKATLTGVRVLDATVLREGEKIVATYHVHLCLEGYAHDVFSRTDVVSAFFSRVPEFMLDVCTGLVHEFDASVDHVKDTGRDVELAEKPGVIYHLPAGRIVGDIGETEPMVDVP